MVPVVLSIPPLTLFGFTLGPLNVYSFGVMMALAFLMGGHLIAMELERRGLDPEHATGLIWWGAIGGLLGARLLVVLIEWRSFLADPITFLFSGAGFIWYGGLVGGTVAVTVYIWRNGLRWLEIVDVIAPSLPMGHAIGRIGCQISGDGDWGPPSSLPWAMSYPRAVVDWDQWVALSGWPIDVRVHPSPVYETFAYSLAFLVIWSLRERKLAPGSLFWIYLILSSIARFAVEIVRVEPVVGFGLTQAQWFAIGLAALGGLLLVIRRGSADEGVAA